MRTERKPGSGVLPHGRPGELWAGPVTRLWRRPLCRGESSVFAASEWEGRSSPAASFVAMDLGGFAFLYSAWCRAASGRAPPGWAETMCSSNGALQSQRWRPAV